MKDWLKKYYGPQYVPVLRPSLVQEGRKHALVRLTSAAGITYVFVQMNGQHGVTPTKVAFEGIPGYKDLERLRQELATLDA
jgi:hypothetical protein